MGRLLSVNEGLAAIQGLACGVFSSTSTIMSPTYRPPRKASPAGLTDPDTDEETVTKEQSKSEARAEWIAYRVALGWSQLRAALFVGVARTTVEKYESRRDDKHTTIPAWAKDKLRRKAQELTGCDSKGRLKSAKAVG